MSINGESSKEQARRELKEFEPISHTDGWTKTKAQIKNLPSIYNCEKHGEYKPRTGNCFINDKYFYNTCCVKCIEEFDERIEKREIEIDLELKTKALITKANRRIETLHNRGVSKRYIDNSFDNYTTDTPDKQNALLKCKELCHSIINNNNAPNLIMVGGVGTGKTHLANSMVVKLTDNGKVCVRANMIDIIRRLKSTWSKDSEETEEDVIDLFVGVDLLIIDEVGIQFNSDTEKMFMFAIINGRYDDCLPTVIISNLDVDGVKEIIGDRCIDRLREDGGKVVAFNWSSHR